MVLNPSSARMVLLFSDFPNGVTYNTLFEHFNPSPLLEFFKEGLTWEVTSTRIETSSSFSS